MSIKNNTQSLQDLLDAVNALPEAGGVELPELTNEGSASDLLYGKELIDSDGNVVAGTIPTKTASNLTVSGATVTVPAGYYASQASKSVATATQATPSITIDANGLITATATQTAGYVAAGTKSATKQLAFQEAKTITPSRVSQLAVPSAHYTGGNVVVAGDGNLIPSNIKSGVSIFGVNGSYEGSGGGTGGSSSAGDWINVASLPTTYAAPSTPPIASKNYYIELEDDVNYVLFAEFPGTGAAPLSSFIVYWKKQSLTSSDTVLANTSSIYTINDVSTDGVKILELVSIDSEIADCMYFLPIYNKSL